MPFSALRHIPTNGVSGRAQDGVLEVEYGNYPQQAVPTSMQNALENLFQQGLITKTGNSYTVDSREGFEYTEKFLPRKIEEYEYGEKRYVRVLAMSNFGSARFELSNGSQYQNGNYVWVEVQPVNWLIDEKAHIMLSEKLLFAGVQFKHERNYKGNFQETDIKKYMDQYFSKDLVQSIVLTQTDFTSREILGQKIQRNPYGFNFDPVSEEEIIKGALESNIAVFLHGRSSEGKSARVKQFDPDCEIIYLRNATPDSLNGKSVWDSARGEMIDVPPTWYKKIEKKCMEDPNRIHILFFDEITNALPSIQGMAFNIVLDGEVNGMWRLPSNCRIVAAGNDLNDSLAANTMAEPLFNRFAHVYVHTTTENWLRWAVTPKSQYERLAYEPKQREEKIHPSIYAYVAYKSYGGQDVLRTPYNGETPNADPRKWEMASKVLYATKQPEMLRALIGEELTRDFVAFTQQPVLTVENILNHEYSDTVWEMNLAEKFATAIGLSSVDEENLSIIRSFVMKLGPEIGAAFDSLWIHGDEERYEKIAELKMEELSVGGVRR